MDDLIGKIGALLVGNRTFRRDDPYKAVEDKEGRPLGGGWTGHQFVLTHHSPGAPVEGVTFVGDLQDTVAAAKAAAGDKYVNVLGAITAKHGLGAGALDEVLVLIAPVLLGDGVRLFDHPGGRDTSSSNASASPRAAGDKPLLPRRPISEPLAAVLPTGRTSGRLQRMKCPARPAR